MDENNTHIKVPISRIGNETWLILKNLDKKIIFRADSIEKNNKRIPDPSGHRMDQAEAEGSVKCKPKRDFDLSAYLG